MRRKKLWYVPGLYSLLGLPILLLLFGPEDVQEKVSLRFFLADDRHHEDEFRDRFTSDYVLQEAKALQATTIDFWDSPFDDLSTYCYYRKLDFLSKEIERMAFVHDSTALLKIELGDRTTYGEFVDMLNQLVIYRIKRYALIKNTLYVFPQPVPANPELDQQLDPIYVDVDYNTRKGPSRWDILNWYIEEQSHLWRIYIRHNYILISGFLLLIVLPFIIRIRKLRKIHLQPRYPVRS